MSIDPRHTGATLWALWVVAGALGGGLATLLAVGWLGAMVSGSDDPTYDLKLRAYMGTSAAIAALFQSLVLTFVAPGKRAVLLWLLATVIGAGVLSRLLEDFVFNVSLSSWFTSLPADTASAIRGRAYATYALALGLAQGLALALITARKMATVIWVAGSLMALAVSNDVVPHVCVGPCGAGTSLIASTALYNGVAAAVTGLALVLILRLGRSRRATAPALAARLPQVPTP